MQKLVIFLGMFVFSIAAIASNQQTGSSTTQLSNNSQLIDYETPNGATSNIPITGEEGSSHLVNHGLYLGLGLGISNKQNLQRNDYPYAANDLIDVFIFPIDLLPNVVFNPYLGFRFNDFVAFEVGYRGITGKKMTGGVGLEDSHYRLRGPDFALKLIYPFAGKFSIFAKGGFSVMFQDFRSAYDQGKTVTFSSKQTKMLGLIGAGLAYNFTPGFAINLNFSQTTSAKNIRAITYGGIGVDYTFNMV